MRLLPAETHAFPSPIPTQFVSSDEFMPAPQTERQKQVEARIKELGDRLAKHQGMSRRAFFKTAAGMAAAFVAMNDVYGPIFGVSQAEAASPDMANERAKALAGQFIMDMHTHFLRDDTRLEGFVRSREAVGKAGWNPALAGKPQTLEDLKFANYFKEIYFDSDTKVALISGSGSEEPRDWFLTNEMKADARAKVNRLAGSQAHVLARDLHAGHAGLDGRGGSRHRAAQARLVQGLYRRRQHQQAAFQASLAHGRREAPLSVLREAREGGARQRVRAQGPLSAGDHASASRSSSSTPTCATWARPPRTGRSSTSSSTTRPSASPGGAWQDGLEQFEKTGRVDWVTDLAEIPEKYGVKNVYGDLGQIFAQSTVAEPRLCAAMMGMLVKGLGADHVVWGTDAVWTGAPQWQIEALRRLEIPEDMQKKHGFAPLGPADGPVKRAIFSSSSTGSKRR